MRNGSKRIGQTAEYRIRVLGRLDRRWTGWFPDLRIRPFEAPDGTPETLLSGTVPDQAALRGILCRLWDLGLTVSAMERRTVEIEERSS